MSGLFHEFLDTINIQRLDWSSFNKKLERILKIYEGKDLVNTKIQEARELLAPSWSHLCVKAKEELDKIFSKVCEEAERKTLKSRDVAYLCPSTLQIFTLVWEVDHFQDWRSELPRKMLQQLLEEIITLGNKSRSLMAQRDAVKAKKELWEDWETLRPESQCRILVELMIFKDTIFNIVQNNKTEGKRKRNFPKLEVDSLMQAACSDGPIKERQAPNVPPVVVSSSRRRNKSFRRAVAAQQNTFSSQPHPYHGLGSAQAVHTQRFSPQQMPLPPPPSPLPFHVDTRATGFRHVIRPHIFSPAPTAPEDQLHNFHIHGNAAWSEQVMDPTFNGTPVQAYQHLPSSLGVYQPEQDQNLNNLDPSGFTFPCDANPSYRHNYYPH